eukprot:COSAG01_NODE_69304_length_261_cov_2.240741_1_plen_40_part_01
MPTGNRTGCLGFPSLHAPTSSGAGAGAGVAAGAAAGMIVW